MFCTFILFMLAFAVIGFLILEAKYIIDNRYHISLILGFVLAFFIGCWIVVAFLYDSDVYAAASGNVVAQQTSCNNIDYYDLIYDSAGDVVAVRVVNDDGSLSEITGDSLSVEYNVNYCEPVLHQEVYEPCGIFSYIFWLPEVTVYKLYVPADF